MKIVVNDAGTRVDFYLYNDSGTELWTDYLESDIPSDLLTCRFGSWNTTGGTGILTYLDWAAYIIGPSTGLVR
jgi:hypothetical protein